MNFLVPRHAIDWLPEENKVRILAGKGGIIVTTLQLPNVYPFSGQITVVHVKGIPNDIQQDSLKVKMFAFSINVTLLHYDDYLHYI